MSSKALIYILGVILAGGVVGVLALPSQATLDSQWLLLLILVALTTLSHLVIAMGIGNDAWTVNLVFLFAGSFCCSRSSSCSWSSFPIWWNGA